MLLLSLRDGTLTQLSGGGFPSTTGKIESVAINNVGAGIIGGQGHLGVAYAALVASDGALTQLSGTSFPALGISKSVAINDLGVGIIGGRIMLAPNLLMPLLLPLAELLPNSSGQDSLRIVERSTALQSIT